MHAAHAATGLTAAGQAVPADARSAGGGAGRPHWVDPGAWGAPAGELPRGAGQPAGGDADPPHPAGPDAWFAAKGQGAPAEVQGARGGGGGPSGAAPHADAWFEPDGPVPLPRPDNPPAPPAPMPTRATAMALLLARLLRRRVCIRAGGHRLRGVLVRVRPEYATLATAEAPKIRVVHVVLRHIVAVELR